MGILERVAVLGDFDCDLDERVRRDLRARGFVNAMERTGGGVQLTMDTVGISPWRIDHVYASPALAPGLCGAQCRLSPRQTAG